MRPFTKKILVIIIAAVIYCVLERFIGISTSVDSIRITYAQPFIVWISVLAGPVVGGFSGGLGELLSQVEAAAMDYVTVVCTILNCVVIGYFTRNIDVKNGFFERNEVYNFEKVQVFSCFGVWGILFAVLNALINKEKFWMALGRGFWIGMNNSISCMLLTSLLLSLYAKTRMTAANFYRD